MQYPRSSYLEKRKSNKYEKSINSSFKLEYMNFNYIDEDGLNEPEPVWDAPDSNYTWRGLTGKNALCNRAFHVVYNTTDGIAGQHVAIPERLSRWDDFVGGEFSGLASYVASGREPGALAYILNRDNACGTDAHGNYNTLMNQKIVAYMGALPPRGQVCATLKMECYATTSSSSSGAIDGWSRGGGDKPDSCGDLDQMCENDSNGNSVPGPNFPAGPPLPTATTTPEEISTWTYDGSTGGKSLCTLLDRSCAGMPVAGAPADMLYACDEWFNQNCNKTAAGISYMPAQTPAPSSSGSESDGPVTVSNLGSIVMQKSACEEKLKKEIEKGKKNMMYGVGGAVALILILIFIIILSSK